MPLLGPVFSAHVSACPTLPAPHRSLLADIQHTLAPAKPFLLLVYFTTPCTPGGGGYPYRVQPKMGIHPTVGIFSRLFHSPCRTFRRRAMPRCRSLPNRLGKLGFRFCGKIGSWQKAIWHSEPFSNRNELQKQQRKTPSMATSGSVCLRRSGGGDIWRRILIRWDCSSRSSARIWS